MTEIRRQLFHMTNGTIIILVYLHWGKIVGIVLAILSLISLIVLKSKLYEKIGLIKLIIDLFEREENLNNPGIGGITFLIGMALTIVIFPPYVTLGGLIALTYGDATSTIVGKTIGKFKINLTGKKRTVEGCIGFILGATIIGSIFTSIKISFLSGLIGCFIELVSPIDDNLTIPTFTSLTLWLLYVLT